MAENRAEGSGKMYDRETLRRLFPFITPYRGRFIFLIFLTVFLGFLAPIRPMLIQFAIDGPVANADGKGLQNMVILMFGLLIVQAIGTYWQTFLSNWIGQTIIRDMRIRLYSHILRLRIRFFDNTQIGRLITRNISDIETIADVFSEGLAAMAGDVLQLVFILAYMFYIDWKLTLVSLSMLPFLLLSTYIFKERIKVTFNEVRSAVANLSSFVQERLTGMSVVQIFGAENQEMEKFKAINAQHRKANIRSVLYYSIYFPVAEVISAVGTGLLVWYGSKAAIQDTVTLGTLTAFIMYIAMFFRPIRTIADRFNTLQLGLVSTERILKLLDNNDKITDTGILRPESLRGDIQFEKVWFAYNDDNFVLKNVSFSCKAGETLALVGATGSGKSSIINLLTRFYEHQKGSIFLDGQPIEAYSHDYLRKHIGLVLQDVFLFRGSIRYNITLGNPDISDLQIRQAADLVGATPFIENLPGGFDYPVMERGATLSVGQRQLISFVRAMVYQPQILILDEATSSVDSEMEEMIQTALERIMKNRTSVVIAHRLSTIQRADKILVVDEGEIKESGTHETLLELGGYYSRLYQMQYRSMVS
ncbi:MAG TPA: ABC transporter ATP-binding protein [Catalimonadaceae bacterium]|nr:ABC transporter ATP-binding protein [Catalimonadaceae bacterium]